MAIVLSTPPYQQFYDSDGNPLSGGKIYTYLAGTLTPQATYTDQGGGTPSSNPIILDSSGRAEFWLDSTNAYDYVITDSADNTIRTVENVQPFTAETGLATIGNIASNTIVGNNTGGLTTPLALTVSQVTSMLFTESTFTPVIVGSTSAGTATYTQQRGTYKRLGNIIWYQIYLVWSGHTGTGNMTFSGFPVTSAGLAGGHSAGQCWYSNLVISSGKEASFVVDTNATTAALYAADPAGGANAAVAIDASGQIIVSGFYFT